MGPITISLEDFRSLKSGDQIVWRGKYLRTVSKGPVDMSDARRHPAVRFPIRHRSWTKRIDTIYNYNDVKDKITLARGRTRGLMLKSEWKTLEVAGFDVRKELARELQEAEERFARGRRPCKAYRRLAKLIRGKQGTGKARANG